MGRALWELPGKMNCRVSGSSTVPTDGAISSISQQMEYLVSLLYLIETCSQPSEAFVGFEVLTAVVMKSIILWDITRCVVR
jgi:hypothetical protein